MKRSNIKIGTKLRCLKAYAGHLTKDNIYVVEDIKNGSYFIRCSQDVNCGNKKGTHPIDNMNHFTTINPKLPLLTKTI